MTDGRTAAMQEGLDRHREKIVARWVELTVREGAAHCETSQDRDRFRNPAAFLVEANLRALFDALRDGLGVEVMSERVDEVIRWLTAQGLDGTRAGAFVSPLKDIIRQEWRAGPRENPWEMSALDARIDQLSRIAGDLARRCREQIREIRIREVRRRTWVPERLAAKRPSEGHS